MEYSKLVEAFLKLENTTKRLEKTFYISEILKEAESKDLVILIKLLQGRIFEVGAETKTGIATKMIVKALNIASGISTKEIDTVWKKHGDIGDAAKEIISRKTQAGLSSFFIGNKVGETLTIKKIYDNFVKLSHMEGEGSVDKKVKITSELLTMTDDDGAKFIVRMLLEDLRIGAAEGTIRDSILWAFFPKIVGIFFKCKYCNTVNPNTSKCLVCSEKIENKFKTEIENSKVKYAGENNLEVKDVLDLVNIENYDTIICNDEKKAREIYNYLSEIVQNAYHMINDFGIVAQIAKEQGRAGLLNVKLTPGNPVKVMLYLKAKNIIDGFERVGRPAAIEYKYDGFRMQIHKKNEKITLFSRKFENLTAQFPDVIDLVKTHIKGSSFILDTEIIGVDEKTHKLLPFQAISQRIKRKHNIAQLAKDVPVVISIFDILEYEKKDLLKTPLRERRKILNEKIEETKKIQLAKQIITANDDEAQKFYAEALDIGNEGVMMKNIDSPYQPGARVGFGVKVKPVMETLDLVITKADWGEGKRSKWLASFTVSCKDEQGNYLEIGKVGTGLKELENEEGITFEYITNLLMPHIISTDNKSVIVKPKVVVEINYEEIQKSNTYNSGFALRFPRFVRLREDKGADEASDLNYIELLYESQRGRNEEDIDSFY